jgi:hypothetical protein
MDSTLKPQTDSALSPAYPVTQDFILTRIMALVVFIAGVLLAYVVLSSIPGFVSNDDYYHSRISAQLLEQNRLRLEFPWLPHTLLTDEQFVDHHLLYHLYLAVWIQWGGIAAVKLAQAFIIGGIGLAFWSLLRLLNVRLALIWTIAILALSQPFLYRMLMIRTQAAAVLLLLLTLHILFREQYRWLIVLSFAFTWLYNGFILLPAVVGLYIIASGITQGRWMAQPVFYAVLGMLLGIIINPYFPENIAFITSHLGEKVNLGASVRVGIEWYPYTTQELLQNSAGALAALGLGVLAGSVRTTGRDQIETTVLLIALLTLYMLFRSRRFIEYFPIFALLFCAVAWGRSGIQWQRIVPAALLHPKLVSLRLLGFVLPILLLATLVLKDVYHDVQAAKDLTHLAGAAAWLEANTETDELIFQTDWDDFPYLFYHNTHNSYLVGLDPTYLQVAHPILWNQWVVITQGRVDQPSDLIRDTFGARFIVSDTHHHDFARQAENDPAMQLVYRDANSLIWQITN